MTHYFVICAYGESPYLQACIDSLNAQTEKSPVLLCTATPSERLARLAEENGFTYCVNDDQPNIAGDWNFGLRMAKEHGADYATICHQDDLYLPDYGKALREAVALDPDLLIFFSDYGEQRGDEAVTKNVNLTIKRILLWRMRVRAWQTSPFMKHRTLALGDAISCPAVSFNLNRIPMPLFERGMTTNLDWNAWEKLAKLPGRFHWDTRVLMLHRIHAESTTSKVISKDGSRAAQDYELLRRFWPAPVAKVITKVYGLSEKSNQL